MFKNKVIWITGASSGIGEALSKAFALEGANLVLSGRNQDALSRVANQCEGASGVKIVPFDIADEAATHAAAQTVLAEPGTVDMLINNAGISQRSLAVETEMAAYRRLFDIDVFGQIALTKAVLPHMIERGSGHIAITSSVAGKIGTPFRTGYCAAKHAVMGYYDALRSEVAHKNIQVTTITPGFIRTNIAKNAIRGDGQAFQGDDSSIEGGMDVDEAAKVIMQGFHKGRLEIPVGQGLEMHALRIKRFLPNVLFKMMNKQYWKMAETNNIDAD